MAKTQGPKLALVIWDDAAGSATKVYDEQRDHKPTVMTTVGWILKNDEKGISIACEQYVDEDQQQWRGHTFIPKEMIKDVQALPVMRKKKMKSVVESTMREGVNDKL